MGGRKGSAYIVVIMAMLVLSILALGIISIVMSDYRIAMADSGGNEAYYIADGGATAMVYELKEIIKDKYEQVKAAAQNQQNMPMEEYIKKYFYQQLPLTYPSTGYRRIDFTETVGCYSRSSASFDSNTGVYSIVSEGYARNALSIVRVKLKVNIVFPPSPALDVFSKAVVATGKLGADRDDIIINGDVVVLGGFDTSFKSGPNGDMIHTITINGNLYIPENVDMGDNGVKVNGNVIRINQETVSQLLSIINSFQNFLGGKLTETGQGTLENPSFIKSAKDGQVTVDRNDNGFNGVIYSDDDLRVKINKDSVAIDGAIIAKGNFYSKQNPHKGVLTINYNQTVIKTLVDTSNDFNDFYLQATGATQQEKEMVEIEEWKAEQ